jgi:periplasmic protein TonB
MNRSSAPSPASPPAQPPQPRPRRALAPRRHAERQEARRRVAAQTREALTAAQRAHDPLAHPRPGPGVRAGWLLVVLLVAALCHVGVVAVGFLIGGRDRPQRERVEQTVKVEMREPPPPPPPPPEEKRPEPPPPEPIAKKPPPPPKAAPPPAPAPKGPPPRVVGLSLDSTVEGGGGPAFATGETHNGQTADRAAPPKPVEPTTAPAPPPRATATPNQAASRIPVAGVQYTPPKRRRPHDPPYPETLKAQEIEADVTVMVSIDAAGKVTTVKIIRAAPYPEFNEVAQKTAREEEFDPAQRDGVPIPYTLSYTYRFRLETP